MTNNLVFNINPKIECQLHNNGFELIDRQTAMNSGFYSYADLQSIDIINGWFPKLSKYLRAITWILNGVPLFPDADSFKKSKLIFHFKEHVLSIELTNACMVKKAKRFKALFEEKQLILAEKA